MAHPTRETDAFGWLTYLLYIGVGGFLVFGFAWSLQSAVDVQNASVCRALDPELRARVALEVRGPEGAAPKDVKITVDGVAMTPGKTDEGFVLFVPQGLHAVRVEAEGMTPSDQEVRVEGAQDVAFAVEMGPSTSTWNELHRRPWVAPDIEVQDLEGRPVRLSDYRGSLVVLNFWATWCEPCIGEWPQVHQLAQRLEGNDDVVVLAVSIDEDPKAILPFLERMSLSATPATVAWDPTQSVQRSFGTEKIPDSYFIDEQGVVRYAFVNVRKWGSPEAYHCVEGSKD